MGVGLESIPNVGPNDEKLNTKQVVVNVPAGTTRIINIPEEFHLLGNGFRIDNRSIAAANFRVGGPSAELIPINATDFYALGGVWISQIEIQADAGGACLVMISGVPIDQVV